MYIFNLIFVKFNLFNVNILFLNAFISTRITTKYNEYNVLHIVQYIRKSRNQHICWEYCIQCTANLYIERNQGFIRMASHQKWKCTTYPSAKLHTTSPKLNEGLYAIYSKCKTNMSSKDSIYKCSSASILFASHNKSSLNM